MSLLDLLGTGRPNGIRARLRALAGRDGERQTSGNRPPAARAATHAPEPAERALALPMEPPRDVTPPDGYEVVLHKDALEPGRIIDIIIGGTSIAVANVEGSFHAIASACPHADGPLGEGHVEGCTVTCPYHGWRFDLTTGECSTVPGKRVRTYPVQLVGNAVCVQL